MTSPIQSQSTHHLTGPYLGQQLPGDEPVLFAPGVVSTDMYERDVAMTPDGKEFYFCLAVGLFKYTTILRMREVDGQWQGPEVAPFAANPAYMFMEPFISPDGQHFYFMSNMPDSGQTEPSEQTDIWVMTREENGWGIPGKLPAPVNSAASEYFPSVTFDGTIYFTRENQETRASHIFRSRLVDGVYQEAEELPEVINCTANLFNAYIAPDESYLIVPIAGRADSYGRTDYYVAFRTPDDQWSEPINLGDKVNTAGGQEWSPYVSPDGKFFFFMSSRTAGEVFFDHDRMSYEALSRLARQPGNGNADIYWMSSAFIEKLRPEGF